MSVPYDKGLQPERTLLAWRRTCLALGVACAAIARFATEVVGLAAVFIGIVGVALAAVAYVMASVQYRRRHDRLHREDATGGDGLPLALTGAATIALAAGCLVFVLGSSGS